MKKTKFLIPLVAVLAVALTACSGGNSGSGEAATGEDVMAASMAAMADVTSYSADINMVMNVDTADGAMNMDMASTLDCVASPTVMAAMDSTITMDMAGQQLPIAMQVYVAQDGDNLNVYTYSDMTGGWSAATETMDNIGKYIQQDPQDMMALYTENQVGIELLGEEAVGDVTCNKLQVTITPDSFMSLMGSMGNMESLGVDTATMSENLAKGGDLVVTLWIDKDTNMMVKESMDMSEFLTNILAASSEDTSAINSMSMTMDVTFGNYNAVEPIVVPDEALAAPVSDSAAATTPVQ